MVAILGVNGDWAIGNWISLADDGSSEGLHDNFIFGLYSGTNVGELIPQHKRRTNWKNQSGLYIVHHY